MRIVSLLAAAFLTACASVARDPPTLLRADAPSTLYVEDDGPWHEVTDSTAVSVTTPPPPRPLPPAAPPVPRDTTQDVVRIPVRRAPPAAAEKPIAQKSREVLLDHPTHVRARTITFQCPRAFAGEIRGSADDTSDTETSRRLVGHARLLCRELTLDADEILLRWRDDPEVRVMARGDASFVSERSGNVLRESNLRALILSGDAVTPLR